MVGRDRIVVEFTTTYVSAVYHHSRCEFESCSDEVYSIQHYVIKFVSDLWLYWIQQYVIKFVSDLWEVDGFSGYSTNKSDR